MDGFQRITEPLLDVVAALVDAHRRDEEVHGWALIEATRRSGPTIYKILDKLEDAHLVEAYWEDRNPTPGKPPRRLYRLNESGFAQARQLLAERRPARDASGKRRTSTPRPGLNTLVSRLMILFGGVR
jgi:PadR family transcriptional regulator PadR